jgi:hypothetical protein
MEYKLCLISFHSTPFYYILVRHVSFISSIQIEPLIVKILMLSSTKKKPMTPRALQILSTFLINFHFFSNTFTNIMILFSEISQAFTGKNMLVQAARYDLVDRCLEFR